MAASLRVKGMSCGHCVAAITKAVERVPGVTNVEVDLANDVVRVDGTPDEHAVVAAIEDSGSDVDISRTANKNKGTALTTMRSRIVRRKEPR